MEMVKFGLKSFRQCAGKLLCGTDTNNFLQILPTTAFLFSVGLTPRIPQTVYTDTCEHIVFFLFSFSVFYFLVVGSMR